MSTYFFDASALVKRYMPEQGSSWVRTQMAPTNGYDIVIAQITPVEFYSALARQFHDGHIDLERLQAFRRLFMYHTHQQYLVIGLTDVIVNTAMNLQERYRLRAYDAVQLASAVELQARLTASGQTSTFVVADIQLLQAATAEGLTTHNPIDTE
jgi:predicted nucleic acid-binding protein